MVSVLVSSVVDRGFNPQLGQTKDYKIDICYFSFKFTALTNKCKDWLAGNRDNVSECNDISTRLHYEDRIIKRVAVMECNFYLP